MFYVKFSIIQQFGQHDQDLSYLPRVFLKFFDEIWYFSRKKLFETSSAYPISQETVFEKNVLELTRRFSSRFFSELSMFSVAVSALNPVFSKKFKKKHTSKSMKTNEKKISKTVICGFFFSHLTQAFNLLFRHEIHSVRWAG